MLTQQALAGATYIGSPAQRRVSRSRHSRAVPRSSWRRMLPTLRLHAIEPAYPGQYDAEGLGRQRQLKRKEGGASAHDWTLGFANAVCSRRTSWLAVAPHSQSHGAACACFRACDCSTVPVRMQGPSSKLLQSVLASQRLAPNGLANTLEAGSLKCRPALQDTSSLSKPRRGARSRSENHDKDYAVGRAETGRVSRKEKAYAVSMPSDLPLGVICTLYQTVVTCRHDAGSYAPRGGE